MLERGRASPAVAERGGWRRATASRVWLPPLRRAAVHGARAPTTGEAATAAELELEPCRRRPRSQAPGLYSAAGRSLSRHSVERAPPPSGARNLSRHWSSRSEPRVPRGGDPVGHSAPSLSARVHDGRPASGGGAPPSNHATGRARHSGPPTKCQMDVSQRTRTHRDHRPGRIRPDLEAPSRGARIRRRDATKQVMPRPVRARALEPRGERCPRACADCRRGWLLSASSHATSTISSPRAGTCL